MRKDYELRELRVKRRGPLPGLDEGGERPGKVRITIALDTDLVEHFKGQAAKPGGLPYQTQINQALRQYIERVEADAAMEVDDLKAKLLADPKFLAALAAKIEVA